jgi:2,3-bisphosphoglycerate-dependent phosphoglycerate mutase
MLAPNDFFNSSFVLSGRPDALFSTTVAPSENSSASIHYSKNGSGLIQWSNGTVNRTEEHLGFTAGKLLNRTVNGSIDAVKNVSSFVWENCSSAACRSYNVLSGVVKKSEWVPEKSVNPYCNVYLIRHGETDWNYQGKLQGHTDIPLNKRGEDQALRLKEKLKDLNFSAIYSSDLSRARKTAIIALGSRDVKIMETSELRERNWGQLQGKNMGEIKTFIKAHNLSTESLTQKDYLTAHWPGDQETLFDVYNRFDNFIKSKTISCLGTNILLSSHGGVLRSVLFSLNFTQGYRWEVPNCACLQLRVYKDGKIEVVDYDTIYPEKADVM